MKQIIFALAFIYCVICDGPAYNVPDRAEGHCSLPFMYAEYAEYDGSLSVSSCVDRELYNFETYYDKCCYVRFQLNGQMHQGCVGLTQEQFSDTTETIYKMENGDRLIWTSAARNSKIYQLDCNASYLKFISLAVALIGLLL